MYEATHGSPQQMSSEWLLVCVSLCAGPWDTPVPEPAIVQTPRESWILLGPVLFNRNIDKLEFVERGVSQRVRKPDAMSSEGRSQTLEVFI